MRTTTVVYAGFIHHGLTETDFLAARDDHRINFESKYETFTKTHGCSSDNLVSATVVERPSSSTPMFIVRSWPDLGTAQAWVDFVLAGNLAIGLDYPALYISAQVDPE